MTTDMKGYNFDSAIEELQIIGASYCRLSKNTLNIFLAMSQNLESWWAFMFNVKVFSFKLKDTKLKFIQGIYYIYQNRNRLLIDALANAALTAKWCAIMKETSYAWVLASKYLLHMKFKGDNEIR